MKNKIVKLPLSRLRKGILMLIALSILTLVYIFQRSNFLGIVGINIVIDHPNVIFIINRFIRLVLNDFACILLIYIFFQEKKYLQVGFLVFLVELLLILPLYLFIKLSLEGDSEISSPLLSHIHRLIVNPLLMFLLMGGIFYQRFKEKNQ